MANQKRRKGPIKRSGTRRFGDDYQDLKALEIVVDWLEHSDRYLWMQVEADNAGSLDDVVALRSDGSLVARQIKYAVHPDDDDDPYSWEILLKKDDNSKVAKSLLQKWSNALQSLATERTIREASVHSNRKPAPDLQRALKPDGHVEIEQIEKSTLSLIDEQLGTSATSQFLGQFEFHLNQPNLEELEIGLRIRFFRLGGTEQGWLNLKEQMRLWVGRRDVPTPEGTITLDAIKSASLWNPLQALPQRFGIPFDFVLPSQAFHKELLSNLKRLSNGCIVLTASPGVGKSTYMSWMYEQLRSEDVPVLRHHYYLSSVDQTASQRLDATRAAESMMHELLDSHKTALGEASAENPQPTRMREWITQCGSYYSGKGEAIVILIDGLDHVWRERGSIEELRKFLDLLLPAPKGVVVLLATQPVADEHLPPCVLRAAPRSEWQELPLLDQDALGEWLGYHRDAISSAPGEPEEHIREAIFERIVKALYAKTSGHPLHLRYSVRALEERSIPISEQTVALLPASPHGDISDYYGELWRALDDDSRQILHLLSACSFPWTRQGIYECLDPKGDNSARIARSLRLVEHMLVRTPLGLQPFHSSLIVFLQGLDDHEAQAKLKRRQTLDWLKTLAPERWAWAYTWRLEAELGNVRPLLEGPNRQWLLDALVKRRDPKVVLSILLDSIKLALKQRNLPRAIELGSLSEYFDDAFRLQRETVVRLTYTQLNGGEDNYLSSEMLANLDGITDEEISALAQREATRGAIGEVNECYRELGDRLATRRTFTPGNLYPTSNNILAPYINTAALPGGISPLSMVELACRNIESGYAEAILTQFAQKLRMQSDVPNMRKLLGEALQRTPVKGQPNDIDSVTQLRYEDVVGLVRHAALLAVEQDADFDTLFSLLPEDGNAFVNIYAAVRKNQSLIKPGDLGDDTLLNLAAYEFYNQPEVVPNFFYTIFFRFLANHLAQASERNAEWLQNINTLTWSRQFLYALNECATILAESFRNGTPPTYGWIFRQIDYLDRPQFSGGRNQTPWKYGEAAAQAMLYISLDLLPVFTAAGGTNTIGTVDIQDAWTSTYCDPKEWLTLYVSRYKTALSDDALRWLFQNREDSLAALVEPYPERAAWYALLANVATIHGTGESASNFAERASANLVSYGYHKDLNLDQVLEAVLRYYRHFSTSNGKVSAGLIEESRAQTLDWLTQLAPGVAHIRDFTDGDETRHLPRTMAYALSEVVPPLLPAYHQWLIEQEDYDDAQHTLNAYLSNADLSDPLTAKLAATAVDEEARHIIQERVESGDAGASAVLDSWEELYGDNISISESEENANPVLAETSEKPAPAVDQFSPERLYEYVAMLRSRWDLDRGQCMRDWIKYWCDSGQESAVFDALEDAKSTGRELGGYDAIFEMVLSLQGRDAAYEWLLKAQMEGWGWEYYLGERRAAEERWNAVIRYYPSKWWNFLEETLLRGPYWYQPSLGYSKYSRITQFLLTLNQTNLAESAIAQMVSNLQALWSAQTLTSPGWLQVGVRNQ